MQQVPGNPPPQQYSRGMQYFIGIAIGIIPLLLGMLFLGSNIGNSSFAGYLALAAVISYIAVFIGMIVCLCITRVRFVGYGLLTMVLAAPVVFFVACTVLFLRSA